MFTGTYTAMVTPFRNGQLDEPALEGLIKLQIKGGVDGIVPVGTTGESPTVDCAEHIRIIELAVKFANKKIKVRAALDPKFTILSGDDSLTLPFMAVGAQGVISVASNVIPREVSQMVKLFASGKSAAALRLHEKFYPLFKDLFIETNPTPVKAALAMMKLIEEEYRLPLVQMNPKNWEILRTTLKRCGVLD